VPSNAILNSGNGGGANSGDGDTSTFWSSTKDKTPVENAYGHSTKHGDEFPQYQNSVQYVQAAQDFVNNPPDGTLTKIRPNGDTLYYDPATNSFSSNTKDGDPTTMIKPTAGMDYWNIQ
jgi:filamentous hemagglutinin